MNRMKSSLNSTTATTAAVSNLRMSRLTTSSKSSALTRRKLSLPKSVRFNDFSCASPNFRQHEKYLTAKYPQHQMKFIRQRILTEFWLDEQLQYLHHIEDDHSLHDDKYSAEIIIDALLKLSDDIERRQYLINKFKDIKQSPSIILELINELLHRLNLLWI